MTKLVLAASALVLLAPFAAALEIETPLEKTHWIVGFHDMPDIEVGDTYNGAEVIGVTPELRFIVIATENAELFNVRATLDDNVRYVEYDDPNWAHPALTPNDSRYGDAGMYGVKITKINLAWDVTLGSTAVKVGVLDTGIKRTHEDFAGGRVLQGWDFYNNDNDPNDQGGLCSYHGSHTAGTIGATTNNAKGIAGVAQATILPVKAFGGWACGGSASALTNGLKYIADQGGHVSSNSWGSSSASTAFNDAIDYAHSKGTIHVAAAGNDGACTNCVSYPWKDRPNSVIIVSASDSADKFASFSSEGPQVDVIAPGVGILSVDGAGTTGYKTLDGTSMACPHVAGVAALMKTRDPTATFATVEGKIKSTADNIGLSSDRQGSGRLDGQGAVA